MSKLLNNLFDFPEKVRRPRVTVDGPTDLYADIDDEMVVYMLLGLGVEICVGISASEMDEVSNKRAGVFKSILGDSAFVVAGKPNQQQRFSRQTERKLPAHPKLPQLFDDAGEVDLAVRAAIIEKINVAYKAGCAISITCNAPMAELKALLKDPETDQLDDELAQKIDFIAFQGGVYQGLDGRIHPKMDSNNFRMELDEYYDEWQTYEAISLEKEVEELAAQLSHKSETVGTPDKEQTTQTARTKLFKNFIAEKGITAHDSDWVFQHAAGKIMLIGSDKTASAAVRNILNASDFGGLSPQIFCYDVQKMLSSYARLQGPEHFQAMAKSAGLSENQAAAIAQSQARYAANLPSNLVFAAPFLMWFGHLNKKHKAAAKAFFETKKATLDASAMDERQLKKTAWYEYFDQQVLLPAYREALKAQAESEIDIDSLALQVTQIIQHKHCDFNEEASVDAYDSLAPLLGYVVLDFADALLWESNAKAEEKTAAQLAVDAGKQQLQALFDAGFVESIEQRSRYLMEKVVARATTEPMPKPDFPPLLLQGEVISTECQDLIAQTIATAFKVGYSHVQQQKGNQAGGAARDQRLLMAANYSPDGRGSPLPSHLGC